MTYSVYQPWDPLEVCVVGRSYSPEFYSYIENPNIRAVFERIARETEEDFQTLITVLESFDVEILRPMVGDDYRSYLNTNQKISPAPICPRDYLLTLGNNFYIETNMILASWNYIKGSSWGDCPATVADIPQDIVTECADIFNLHDLHDKTADYADILKQIENPIIKNIDKHINSAMITRVGRDLYFGTESYTDDMVALQEKYTRMFPDYRCHMINTGGHADGTFCVVKPGLIISSLDVPLTTYEELFPKWEVIYVEGQQLANTQTFQELKQKNQGKWWIPGEENNNEFIDYVKSMADNWVGYVEETVFDVNMLVINEQNIICSAYNKDIFAAFERHGVTPHIVNFRHRFFWDGGLHCITSDLSRTGTMQDYFPERG